MRSTHQEWLLVEDTRSRWVVVGILAYIRRYSVNNNVAELIAERNRVVVEHGRAGGPSRLTIIGEHQKAILLGFENGPENGLLLIAYQHPRALCI